MPNTSVEKRNDERLTDERFMYGIHARQVNTSQWIRGFDFVPSLWGWCLSKKQA